MQAGNNKRFGADVDPDSQVISLIGSKDGVAHIPEALVGPGDYVLVPSPGYPVYSTGALFAEAKTYEMPLRKDNGFRPDLDAIPNNIAKKSKLMWINYPNNPTSAIAPPSFYQEVVEFAREHGIVVVSDNAYSEFSFAGYTPPSILAGRRASRPSM